MSISGHPCCCPGKRTAREAGDLRFQKPTWSDLYTEPFTNWALSLERQALCISTPGNDSEVVHLRLADRHVERIAGMKDLHPFLSDLANIGVALCMRDTGYQEIYALNVRWP